MTKIFKSQYIQHILFAVLFITAAIISIGRIEYGFAGYDEAFYLTIPQRLAMGDALFKDEWNLAQMAGLPLYPFYLVVNRINGGTVGMMLVFRYIYLVVHGLVSIFIYYRFRKYGFMAAIATALFFFFTPYNIMALCYNTMPLDLLLLSGVFLSTFDIKKPLYPILSGLCFAGAVLCCPYLLAIYVIYGISVLLKIVWHKIISKENNNTSLLKPSVFFFFTIGAAILALFFFVFVFFRISFADLITNLKFMFDDPEHQDLSVSTKIGYYIWQLQTIHEDITYVYMAYLMTLLVMAVDRKRKNHKWLYFLASGCITLSCYVLFIPMLHGLYYNAMLFPLFFIGLTSYLLCSEKPVDIFQSIFIIGILYSVCSNFASNTGIFAIESAFALTGFASLLFIGIFLAEGFDNNWQKHTTIIVTILLIAVVMFLQYRVKTEYYFKEHGRGKEILTVELTDGPGKGLITSLENAAEYQITYYDVHQFMAEHPDRSNLLVLSEKSWIPLMFNDYPYASFTTWLFGESESTIDRLQDYYNVNPTKTPKYVYIPKDSAWDINKIINIGIEHGYELIETEYSYQLVR